MYLKSYTLPPWEFVGGETKEQQITLRHENGTPYELGAATVTMTIGDFVNRDATPASTTDQAIIEDNQGTSCILRLSLTENDTKDLHGKYLYVVTIEDADGNKAKLRGVMLVYDDAKNVQ